MIKKAPGHEARLVARTSLNIATIYRSVWFFPLLITICLILLTLFKISGSSVGVYNEAVYGSADQNNLIAGRPRPIRSDEWLVNTEALIAQSKVGFPRINHNIGNGQDMSLVIDVPYRDWSVIFKPQDLAFFVMPLENAFAFRWWLMGYLLVIGCYFLALKLLPGKRLVSTLIALAFFFSAFVQWWYQYQTLGTLYYSFFIILSVMAIFQAVSSSKKIVYGLLLAYLLACFALVMYPPFQIPCAFVVAVISFAYIYDRRKSIEKPDFIKSCLTLVFGAALGLGVVALFVYTRYDVIKTIADTAYPGVRSFSSGSFPVAHFFASSLGYIFMFASKASQYTDYGVTNQSEASNFLLLLPFLALPILALTYRDVVTKAKKDWYLIGAFLLFVIFMCEMFYPSFTHLSKLLFLDKVGPFRVLIGVGLLNILALILVINKLEKSNYQFPVVAVASYCLAIFLFQLNINLSSGHNFGLVLNSTWSVLLALPIPVVVYLLLKKHFLPAVLVYLIFSLFTAGAVNPIYKGLGIQADNQLNKTIAELGTASDKRWVTEQSILENIASVNGAKSLSGVYNYPQLDLWSGVPGADIFNYNRYAHVGFEVSSDPGQDTKLTLKQPDVFIVSTYACSSYLRNMDVGFIVSSHSLATPCTELVGSSGSPESVGAFIYRITSP